ncbi:hypothetical protein ACFLZW_04220 [Chloroflexota bacterium]
MKGYDVFFETPGEVTERICQVCGTTCLVERDEVGPTSWTSAMGKLDIVHDCFHCPNSNHPWHRQALELVQAIEKMPSKRVAALMRDDLLDLLNEHGCESGK